MYIFIFMVLLFGLWVLEIYIQWKKLHLYFLFFNFFSSFAFFFSWTTLHFLKCLLYFVGLFRSNVLSLHRGQRILKPFFLVSSGCLVVCFFFLVLLLFLYVFVLTLLVDVFSFLLFLFVYGLCFVGPSTSV